MKISGAEWVIDLLEQQGVDRVTGVPGGALLPLYEALGASSFALGMGITKPSPRTIRLFEAPSPSCLLYG